uniref:Ribosomal RNA adenine dimethylase domain containing 1 n=1 Tax=Sinocyclocheilus grahami TaxID=75366 RepID=A0A672RNW7_SINGR
VEEMFVAAFSEQGQRDLAEKLISLLSTYRHISDSYIIEFFSESLWDTLPVSWQDALGDLAPPQIADLLLDKEIKDRRYPSVWPLSLLALRTAAHALSSPRKAPGGHSQDTGAAAEEFQLNQSQSSLLGHIFRKHVKPKKQHEIRQLGTVWVHYTACNVIGHLTRFLSFGLCLDVTGIDPNLVPMATKFDTSIDTLTKCTADSKTAINTLDSVAQINSWVFPSGTTTEMLTCKTVPVNDCGAKQPGSFVLTGLHASGDLSSTLLRHFANCPHIQVITSVACCYMKISTKENPNPPGLFHDWVHGLPGYQLSYACLAWPRVGLPTDLPFDPVSVDAMLAHQGKVVAYFSLVLLLAPVVETVVLLDRMIFLQEREVHRTDKLIPLFDAAFSPRNLVLVAVEPK